jgi:PKD repeat protein
MRRWQRRRNKPIRKLPLAGNRFRPQVEFLEDRTLLNNGVPTFDHVVFVIEENKAYSQIIGNSAAPYINSLANGGNAALFTQSFAITHPSQPNYLDLFSGSNQGVTTDNLPTNLPFTTPNLGAELLQNGLSFTGYSEDLPSVGFTGATSGAYARKHNPWVNWQGSSTNGIPASDNQPFSAFPTNFAALPKLSIVVPNLNDDMHNGTVAQGDAWLQAHLDSYAQWAKTHNSLLVVTWDEDDNSSANHIATLMVGANVKQGQYSEHINHFNVLRTFEDMYGLPYAGASASATPITDIWGTNPPPALSVSAGPAVSGTVGTAVTFHGSASGGTAPLSYSWNFGDGATATGTLTPSHTYSTAGNFTVTLTVTDSTGAKASASTSANETAPTSPLTASAGSAVSGQVGTPVTFQGSASGGTAPLSYQWNFGDGTTTSGTLTPSHTYSTAGNFTVTLTVTDSKGAQASGNTSANETAATSALTASAGPAESGQVGTPVTFQGSASGGTAPLSYSWNFGDGGTASGTLTPSHTYSSAGNFTVTLTVTDATGTKTSATTSANETQATAGLPSPWTDADIGSPGLAGSASFSNGTFSLQGGGGDIWGTSDQFNFAYQTLSGDGTIIARVNSQQNTDSWAKAGVMIRAAASPTSAYAFVFTTPGSGTDFQYRTSDGGSAGWNGQVSGAAPEWVKLVRSGSTFTGYTSSDGSNWTAVGSINISMGSSILIGLADTAHNNSTLNTSTFSNVSVSQAAAAGLPGPWADADMGSPGLAGSASYSNGTFTVQGGGGDIWSTSDQFNFAYQTLTGDGTIIAQVAGQQNTDPWAKAGIMIRNAASANGAYAFVFTTPGNGTDFQYRTSDGASAGWNGQMGAVAPEWVKLVRSGSSFTAYASSDGSNWTQLGSITISMGATVDIGLANTAHNNSMLNTSTFSNVSVTAGSVSQPVANTNGVYSLSIPNKPVAAGVLSDPNVDGVALRPTWDAIETGNGVYNWSYLDSQIAAAAQAGKKVAISVSAGVNTPAWVYASGVPSFSFVRNGVAGTIPVPYNPTYLAEWTQFVQALGARYGNNPAVTRVLITGINENTPETMLPNTSGDTTNWVNAGYTRTKIENAWQTIADAFAKAFPTKKIVLSVVPAHFPPIDANGNVISGHSADPQLPGDLITLGISRYGQQLAVQNDGLSDFWISPQVTGVANQVTTGYQTLWNVTNDTTNRMTGGATPYVPHDVLQAAVNKALAANARYLEIYQVDILNSTVQDVLAAAHTTLDSRS